SRRPSTRVRSAFAPSGGTRTGCSMVRDSRLRPQPSAPPDSRTYGWSGSRSLRERERGDGTVTGQQPAESYDVAILGGGLAGLTLALQLKRARPETSVFVAEKRAGPAPEAAFKVGESTVELSADYFARVCGMRDHIERDQLFKAGLRFFFP